ATTWHTQTGWVLVRDALTMGPRQREDEITPHTRPPADTDGDHMLVRTVVCLDGAVEIELVCEPVFDYGGVPARWTLLDGGRHAPSDPTLGSREQGPHLHADRRDGRRAHDFASGDTGRRAQLGLPLHLDARLDVHAPGAPLAQPRLGGRRVHAVRRRSRGKRG